MKKATIVISKASNGYIINCLAGLFIANDKKELNLKIADTLSSVIPANDGDRIELEIILKDA